VTGEPRPDCEDDGDAGTDGVDPAAIEFEAIEFEAIEFEQSGDVIEREIDGVRVRGIGVDAETRCAHYDSSRDVVAIAFACCKQFYPCYACHDAATTHEPGLWDPEEFGERAVLCGACGSKLSIRSYLDSSAACPACGHDFNPGCREHADLYFDL
jgi:uncharacterized CHY-type Zn-finger protein